MSMVNIKIFYSLLLLTLIAFVSCGCSNTISELPDTSESAVSEPTAVNDNTSSQAQTPLLETAEAGNTYEPESSDDVPINPYHSYWLTENPDTKYDDDVVPENWLPIYTAAEALRHFDELADVNASGGNVSDEVTLLVNRNVILFETLIGHTYDINWDETYTPEGTETEFHPITLRYFANLDSIYQLAYHTYRSDVADERLFGEENTRQLFVEENGQIYVDVNAMTIWSMDPYAARSYIEITEISDDLCKFIWHYPDREGLNEPDKYKYFYFDKEYTASFVNDAWVLDSFILNN